MSVLVTGGAGYIGSHMVELLVRSGQEVVVVDNLLSGHRDAVSPRASFHQLDIADTQALTEVLVGKRVDTVFHFASRIQVGESVVQPRLYYTGNLASSVALLESAAQAKVKYFIFSSTAAVYGNPTQVPIPEDHPKNPINPYGRTKLYVEHMLADYAHAYGLKYAALRYFNAAGANVAAGLGERHEPETHLIPLVLRAALAAGSGSAATAERGQAITVFGRDYPTLDGTCIRDYIHVSDLVEAHLAALQYLMADGRSGEFNLGTGVGYSVQQVIDTCRAVTGRDFKVMEGPRRAGDPAELVALPERARQLLGWSARQSGLDQIIRDAWSFHSRAADAAPMRT